MNDDIELRTYDDELVDIYDPEIKEVLNRLGIYSYYVTDESDLGDFVLEFESFPDWKEWLTSFLGREPARSDKLWEVGKALRGVRRDG